MALNLKGRVRNVHARDFGVDVLLAQRLGD